MNLNVPACSHLEGRDVAAKDSCARGAPATPESLEILYEKQQQQQKEIIFV